MVAVAQARSEKVLGDLAAGRQRDRAPRAGPKACAPPTARTPTSPLMPSSGLRMNNHETAAVTTYIRSPWGDAASAVSAADNARMRDLLRDVHGLPITTRNKAVGFRVCGGMISRRLLLPALALPATACSPLDLANALTPSGGISRQTDIVYGPGERGRFDLYTPENVGPEAPLIVFFYGGGWRSGARGDYGFVAHALASTGAMVAVPDYRLFPAVRWPSFLEDSAAAVRAIRAGHGRNRPVVLAGHSAGAFNAMALACDPGWLGAGRDTLAGGIGLACPFDFGPADDPAGIFAPAPDARARVAPRDVTALRGAPPLLLLQGTGDTTVRDEQTIRFAALARSQGVPVEERLYDGVGHAGIVAALAAPLRALGLQGAPVLDDIRRWLAQRSIAGAA